MKGKEVKVNNGLDPGDCTKGGGSYVVKCTSDGTTWNPSPAAVAAVDVRTFGAKCDDSTDDATAIQAAINSVGSTATTRSGAHIVIPDHCAIASTLVIDRKAIIFEGLGWGRTGASGTQSYLRWIGSAGSPMLRVQNVQGVQIRDLHFVGKNSAKPSSAISSFNISGFGINSNLIENVAIGELQDDASVSGAGFTDGIDFEGSSGNNGEWRLRNIEINNCARYGIKQGSIQQVNHRWDSIEISNCATAGMYIIGTVSGANWDFGGNAIDVLTPATDDFGANAGPVITVQSLRSEGGSARLLEMRGAGTINVMGGVNHTGSFTNADGRIVIADSANSNTLRFSNFTFNFQTSTPTTAPFIDVTLGSYANECLKELILETCSLPSGGPNSNGIDAQSLGVLDWKHIRYSPPSYGSDPNYVTPKATDVWLGGQFSTGESFVASNVTDIPARFRFSPTFYQHLTAASNSILLDTSLRLIYNETAGTLTLTSTPTIPAGRNGELITIINVGAQAVTLQDNSTLSGSKLKLLNGGTVILAQRDSIQFIYLSSDQTGWGSTDAWVQIGPKNSSPVTSVFGRSGAVVAATNDYTWTQVNKTTSSLADITTRSASDLSSGTLPDARFPATLPAASGVNLTNLNGSNISSGTVSDARLSANIPLLNAANAFTNTGTHTFSGNIVVNTGLLGTDGTGITQIRLNSAGSNWGTIQNPSSNKWAFGYYTNGNTVVGTPALTWAVGGSIQFNQYGAGTLVTDASGNITASSDDRLKDRIHPFTRGLAEILRLRPITYGWNQRSGYETQSLYSGFSAQQVRGVIPEAVGKDGRGYFTLNERPIIGALVNADQEIVRNMTALTLRVTKLENENARLKAQLTLLRQRNPSQRRQLSSRLLCRRR